MMKICGLLVSMILQRKQFHDGIKMFLGGFVVIIKTTDFCIESYVLFNSLLRE
ncbi:hypothetical protein ACHAXS_002969 [Conticribra weissflogii]